MFEWHKKSKLAEQLKFFGAKKQGFISVYAKKQGFISVYAKKPRIRVKVKRPVLLLNGMVSVGRELQLARLQSEQGIQLANLAAQGRAGMQNSGMGMYGGQIGGLYQQQMGQAQAQAARNASISQIQVIASGLSLF